MQGKSHHFHHQSCLPRKKKEKKTTLSDQACGLAYTSVPALHAETSDKYMSLINICPVVSADLRNG